MMQLMEAMVTHLEALLAAPDSGPLSFAVVVPGWTEVPSWAALSSSLFLRRTLLVAKADHGYCDGAQHQRQDRFRDAPYDTAVFFLQNAMGARASLPCVRPLCKRHQLPKAGLTGYYNSDVGLVT
jgi:phosphorylated CTD-interacting factor 1